MRPNVGNQGQATRALRFHTATTAASAGAAQSVDGYNGPVNIEVANTGTGTTSFTVQGSMDGVTWYNIAVQRIDGLATLTPVVGAQTVAANTSTLWQVLSYVEYIQVVLAAPAGAISVTVTGSAVPT